MFAAENEGLSTLLVGPFDPALLNGILPGTEGFDLVAMLNVVYPASENKPSDMHGEKMAIGELVTKIV